MACRVEGGGVPTIGNGNISFLNLEAFSSEFDEYLRVYAHAIFDYGNAWNHSRGICPEPALGVSNSGSGAPVRHQAQNRVSKSPVTWNTVFAAEPASYYNICSPLENRCH